MKIGPYLLDNNLFLAPMAGVTDLPFRRLCKQLGAGVVVSEMVTSDPLLQNSRKTRLRIAQQDEVQNYSPLSAADDDNTDLKQEVGLRIVQIAGGDADMLAEAAKINAARGAQVIDINMGCPAKKVCKKAAGSALLKDPRLVEEILTRVVAAVDIPVTLKIRTGWDTQSKNALQIAKIAEDQGIQSLAVHGRTRACKYQGEAEHETVALVKQAVNIPVIANGDIISPQQAKKVLHYTGADGLMIGRAAQGRPWIFREIDYFLKHDKEMPAIERQEIEQILTMHIKALYRFYGDFMGVRIARKHTGWYLLNQQHTDINQLAAFRKRFNSLDSVEGQLMALAEYFRQ
ncbi:MAG: tRNA dihydrouridine synthase DusB [Enterobacterales bacterium]|nr:tRNA dihydrouridine synthase DusB [Enterobacterales bacterium]